ncbi:MAG: hypothetical protein CR967_02690 [Proteobacteria bacterium]|nr:MAG: hypothetical protein CR967_02690 [Pseudomonadota bacterium]
MLKKEDLIALAKHLNIIHHSKGRIRVRVSPSIKKEQDRFDKQMLESFPKQIKGIKDYKINKLIGSITINYDSEIFEPRIWDELIAGNISDGMIEKIENIIKEA